MVQLFNEYIVYIERKNNMDSEFFTIEKKKGKNLSVVNVIEIFEVINEY